MKAKETLEHHPYQSYFPTGVESIVLGSFPPGHFTNPLRRNEIRDTEIEFYFGSHANCFWDLMGDCFDCELKTKSQIKSFLRKKKIGVANIILLTLPP